MTSHQYQAGFKRSIGAGLIKKPWINELDLADLLEVTDRTLRNWKTQSQGPEKRPGPVAKPISLIEKLKIAKAWKLQGFPGSRPVIAALPGLRSRVVREIVKDLKSRRKQRRETVRKAVQVRVKVKRAGTVATIDGATVRKGEDQIVYRDRASLSVESSSCNGTLQAKHVLAWLKLLQSQGRLPLVMCSDNGSPLCANIVRKFLKTARVIHLKSLPRVPQHNGSAENAVKELKQLHGDGFALPRACKTLNENRKRQQLNYQTSAQFESANSKTYTDQERKKFYEAARDAIKESQLGTKSVYERRKAEREAIFETMESFDLITRTRGGLPYLARPEEIT